MIWTKVTDDIYKKVIEETVNVKDLQVQIDDLQKQIDAFVPLKYPDKASKELMEAVDMWNNNLQREKERDSDSLKVFKDTLEGITNG